MTTDVHDWSDPQWHLPYTRRPCDHPNGPPRPGLCVVCRLYVKDARYRELYDGRRPARPGPPRNPSPPWPPPPPPARDMLRCVHLGGPTGETRFAEKGFG
jgi:hypothetical protein